MAAFGPFTAYCSQEDHLAQFGKPWFIWIKNFEFKLLDSFHQELNSTLIKDQEFELVVSAIYDNSLLTVS